MIDPLNDSWEYTYRVELQWVRDNCAEAVRGPGDVRWIGMVKSVRAAFPDLPLRVAMDVVKTALRDYL